MNAFPGKRVVARLLDLRAKRGLGRRREPGRRVAADFQRTAVHAAEQGLVGVRAGPVAGSRVKRVCSLRFVFGG